MDSSSLEGNELIVIREAEILDGGDELFRRVDGVHQDNILLQPVGPARPGVFVAHAFGLGKIEPEDQAVTRIGRRIPADEYSRDSGAVILLGQNARLICSEGFDEDAALSGSAVPGYLEVVIFAPIRTSDHLVALVGGILDGELFFHILRKQ